MKSKKFTYVLLIIVAIIWYKVFFKVKSSFFSVQVEVVQPNVSSQSFSPIIRDTFKLEISYNDPFIPYTSLSHQLNTDEKENEAHIQRNVSVFVWPSIKYYGMMKKESSKKSLAILSVDDFKLMARKGEELFNGFYVRKIYKDSILIGYKNKRKYFKIID